MSIALLTLSRGYDPPMPLVKRFTHTNGQAVSKLVTESGVTAYLAEEVPTEALLGLERKLKAKIRKAARKQGAAHAHDAIPGARVGIAG